MLKRGIHNFEEYVSEKEGLSELIGPHAARATVSLEQSVPLDFKMAVFERMPRVPDGVRNLLLASDFLTRVRYDLTLTRDGYVEGLSTPDPTKGMVTFYTGRGNGRGSGSYHNYSLESGIEGVRGLASAHIGNLPGTSSGSGGVGTLLHGGGMTDAAGEFVRYFKETLSDIRWIGPERRPLKQTGISATNLLNSDASNLADVLHTLSTNAPDTFYRLQALYTSLFPRTERLRSLTIPGGHTTFAIDERKKTILSEHMSSGAKQALSILTQTVLTPSDGCLIIEEPEIHLHPGVLERLHHHLVAESTRVQTIVITHAPLLVSLAQVDATWTFDENGNVSQLDRATIEKVPDLLGVSPGHSLQHEVVVFVEGETDREVYQVWFTRVNGGPSARVAFVETGGWNNIRFFASAEYMRSLRTRPRVFAILDGDVRKDTNFERAMGALEMSKDHVNILNKASIEDYLLSPETLCGAYPERFPDIEAVASELRLWEGKRNRKVVLEKILGERGIVLSPAVSGHLAAAAPHIPDEIMGILDRIKADALSRSAPATPR